MTLRSIDHPIVLDGMLEKVWEKADSSNTFIQLEPAKGEVSSRKTVLKIAQDEQYLYFSFRCYINQPDEVAARIQRRDRLNESDDIVSILLDTYNDNRTALLFQVNALGTLSDAKVSDDGKSVDYLWDTEWEAKTSITDQYWIAEVRIPFRSIQYNPTSTSWGCNFSRSIRANQEVAWWSPVSESYRVSQNGRLNNVQPIRQKKHNLEFFPYGTARYENSDITGVQNKFKGDAGVDLEYGYSSNLKANLTLNPDFATVEGDKEQINLTPWELRFPEKRLFFQDGNEMFNTRIQTFYSRRIGDVLYGGKVVGKVGKNQFNGLFAQTRPDQDFQIPGAMFGAFRMKRDILESSTLGVSYTDKITDTATFHTFSLDYVMNLGRTWKLTGQYVASIPGDLGSHQAWYVRFARENNTYHYHIRFTSIGKNFQDNVNETGYVPDDDRLEVDSDIRYKFWFRKTFNYLSLSGRNNVFWSQARVLRSWYLTYGARAYTKNNLSFDINYNNEFKLLDREYYNYFYRGVFGYRTDEASNASLSYRTGRNFNRDFNLVEFGTAFQLFKKLTLNYEFNYLAFDPDPDNETTFLNVLGLDYYFTNDLWIRIFSQHNSSSDRIYFYGLFGWRFKPPFGAVYLIYNSDNYYDFDVSTPIHSNILFLKLTYPISVIKR
ncbi:MAG: DUF5916 domain-containing protein [Bacteroidales bacterium]